MGPGIGYSKPAGGARDRIQQPAGGAESLERLGGAADSPSGVRTLVQSWARVNFFTSRQASAIHQNTTKNFAPRNLHTIFSGRVCICHVTTFVVATPSRN